MSIGIYVLGLEMKQDTLPADATPNMEFDEVFWAWFIAGLLILAHFPAAEPPVCLSSLVRPHNAGQ